MPPRGRIAAAVAREYPLRRGKLVVMVADDEPAVVSAAKRPLAHRYGAAIGICKLDMLLVAIARYRPDVLLLDIMWESASALALIPELLAAHPGMRICMHSAYPAPALVGDAFAAGAVGFLTKPAEIKEMYDAVDAVASGVVYLSADLKRIPGIEAALAAGRRPVVRLAVAPFGCEEFERQAAWLEYSLLLSPIEARILLLTSAEGPVKVIAARMARAANTVATHRKEMAPKLRARGVVDRGSEGRFVEQELARMPPLWRPPGRRSKAW